MCAIVVAGLNCSHTTWRYVIRDLSDTPLACLLNALTTARDDFQSTPSPGLAPSCNRVRVSGAWCPHDEAVDFLGYLLMQTVLSSAEKRRRCEYVVGRIFDAL